MYSTRRTFKITVVILNSKFINDKIYLCFLQLQSKMIPISFYFMVQILCKHALCQYQAIETIYALNETLRLFQKISHCILKVRRRCPGCISLSLQQARPEKYIFGESRFYNGFGRFITHYSINQVPCSLAQANLPHINLSSLLLLLSLFLFLVTLGHPTSFHAVFMCCVFFWSFQFSQDILVSLFSSHDQKRLPGVNVFYV